MRRLLRTLWSILFTLTLAAVPLAAKTHVMGRGADPWAVPAWEDVFDEGPFDLPAGGTRESPAEEALALGWKALHELDDREAERAFRLAITRDEENAEGYFGLALANDALPGRALAFANRAVAKISRATPSRQPLIREFAAVCAARGPARRAAEGTWARTVREAWRAAPAGEARHALTALLVRSLLRAGLAAEARLRLRELLAEVPDHPARSYALWFTVNPAEAVAALQSLPVTPGARRAAGAMLERLGRPADAAGWYAAAAALAGSRHPSDMEDWRLVEDMRTAEVAALAAAGRAEFPEEVPVSVRVEAWLRLEAWDRLAAQPDLPAKAPLRERLALAHARSFAGFVQGRLPDAHAWLAEVQQLLVRARSGQGGITPAELPAVEALEMELQLHNLLTRGEADEARARFAQLQHIPPARAARLALALDLPREAMQNARRAVLSRPHAQPERDLLVRIAQTTQQRLRPEDQAAEPQEWPPLPSPPTAAPAAAPGLLPAWSLQGADGAEHSLAGIQDGQPTVVLFFLGHECRHCMDQLRTFDPMAPRFAKAGARLVAVSADGPDGVAKTFASLESEPVQRPFIFPVLADAERRAFAPWGVMDQFYGDAIHGVFVLDGAGRLRWRHLGVEPYMMVADVLAAVEEMGAAP
jgi:peroxiredoxin